MKVEGGGGSWVEMKTAFFLLCHTPPDLPAQPALPQEAGLLAQPALPAQLALTGGATLPG